MRLALALALSLAFLAAGRAVAQDVEAGARAFFRHCAACHALEPGRHMTGPSLGDIWQREAGTVEGFDRYSEALKESGIVWGPEALDAWLADPAGMVPETTMLITGLPDPAMRRDIIALLRAAAEATRAGRAPPEGAQIPPPVDLGRLGADRRVSAISHCRDTYTVTTEDGATSKFWEYNIRFKTDTSERGPAPGTPMILPEGRLGDRAQVVFAAPGEISAFIAAGC